MRVTYRAALRGHSPEQVFSWHVRPGGFERLLPPWERIEWIGHEEGGGSGGKDDARSVTLRMRRGPVSLRWQLRVRSDPAHHRITVESTSGPFTPWIHTTSFLPDDCGGCTLVDEVELAMPAGLSVGRSIVRGELDRLFRFRHARLARDLARHADAATHAPATVAVTGASGLIGTALRRFLSAGGHRVIPVVRASRARAGAITWDPARGRISSGGFAGVDAVVHLAGESIAGGRWTAEKKRAIFDSRKKGTALLSRALAEAGGRVGVMVSASAVGYYGNRGDEILDEDSRPGRGFLADVCRAWEDATAPAARAGLRVVNLRTGMTLSPAGGALGQMLLPFRIGLGGRLGSGRQYVSWIDLDDLVALILDALIDSGLRGPVNATAPNPITNATFTTVLGRVLGRPTLLPVPALAVQAVFGQMGRELLLEGQRVLPRKAQAAGFRWDSEGVDESLSFQLGR